jgi:sugar/nucleoside kinase (ribokinase family)
MRDVPRLFCLDTVLVDVVLTISSLPERAGDVRASSQLITTGGGFNAMSAAVRNDLEVVYAGRLGQGPFASLATSALARERISTPLERHDGLDCGVCVVLVEPDAERTFVTAPGAESTLRESDLATLDVHDNDVVLVSGYNVMYRDMASAVLDWLDELAPGVTVAFDPATRVEDIPIENLRRVLDRTTWLLCNRIEALQLSGETDALAAAGHLAKTYESLNVVVRRGSEGCVVAVSHDEPVAVAGFHTTVLDTTGAGDVHNGVFLSEFALGLDPCEAARRANAAAAMSVAQLGPATSPGREEIDAFLFAVDVEDSTTT